MQHITALALELKASDASEPTAVRADSLGPYLQGVLMEHIDGAYAEYLHGLPFNPYSQYCYREKDGSALLWRVNALTDEAAEHIIAPMRDADSVKVRALGATYAVSGMTCETFSLGRLTDIIRSEVPGDGRVRTRVRFVTPAAFKCQGQYVFMPTLRLVFQNLLMHYGQVYEGDRDVDEETLAYVDQHVRMVSYNLRSCSFMHAAGGGKRVPAFVGSITMGIDGPPTMVGLARMLLKFGEYAGVGIKTSMGMGGISIQ